MTLKHKLISLYIFIGFIFSLYGWLFGANNYKGFFYNLGMGLVWPAVMFPAIGQAIAGLLILSLIAYAVFVKK